MHDSHPPSCPASDQERGRQGDTFSLNLFPSLSFSLPPPSLPPSACRTRLELLLERGRACGSALLVCRRGMQGGILRCWGRGLWFGCRDGEFRRPRVGFGREGVSLRLASGLRRVSSFGSWVLILGSVSSQERTTSAAGSSLCCPRGQATYSPGHRI